MRFERIPDRRNIYQYRAVLEGFEPTIVFNATGDPAGTVRTMIAADATDQVCVFARSESGRWFSATLVADGVVRYGNSAPAGCSTGLSSGWATGGW